jgi:hypothetical protein
MWRVIPDGMLTWAPVGDENVSVTTDAGQKEGITALASVTADCEKLPLFLIAKGKTVRVEVTQLGPHPGCEATHSPSGWTTTDTFHSYLVWLRASYGDPDTIYLILDSYSVHRSDKTRAYAGELNIELRFIPPGWTDGLQPLDRYIFGAMKATCRRLFHRFCQHDATGRVKKRDAVRFLSEAWDNLDTRVIEKGWAIYEDVFGQADDENDGEDVEWEPNSDEDED